MQWKPVMSGVLDRSRARGLIGMHKILKFVLKNLLFLVCLRLGISAFLMITLPRVALAQNGPRRFTVADDIGLTQMGTAVAFSPDDRYFAVASERGRLDLNRSESSIRVYITENVHHFLSQRDTTNEPSPFWTVTKSTYKDGPIISHLRWLPDSRGLTFLAKTADGNDQLFLANIHARTIQALTPENQQVTGFDVQSSGQFVYTALSPAIRKKAVEDGQADAIPGTGLNLHTLIFPEESMKPNIWIHDLSELFVVRGHKRFRVVDHSSGHAIPIHLEGQRSLALSPDGRYVVTALTVSNVPPEWETLYPPPFPAFPYRVRAGPQNPNAFKGQRDISEYVLVDLASGKITPLSHAPIGNTAGWVGMSYADWSSDGKSIVLSDTFLPPSTEGTGDQPNWPCVAVADVVTGHLTCLERLKERTKDDEQEAWRIDDVHFVSGNKGKVIVRYLGHEPVIHVQSGDGSWKTEATASVPGSKKHPINASIKQDLNHSPVLIATDRQTLSYRIIWNPNKQLKDIEMGQVSVFKWKDKTGRDWVGGLYRPPDYVPGKRYPLVIQTHGFDEQEFRPSGAFTTAFAAQELAAVGFAVLQLEDCPSGAAEEGSCQVAGYEAAVERLTAEGLVDPDRIGIIGFSRTCYYVLAALTTSTLHFRAASITDGVNFGYLQYLTSINSSGSGFAHEANMIIGAPPFGAGLEEWLKRSPDFNLHKVTAPLLIVALGRSSVLSMWEPYAALRFLSKPVDLLVLKDAEHILSNPAARMASQGGTVDWFRFWLQDYEDQDPAKSEQYKRWEVIRGQRDSVTNGTSSVYSP
jgi:dipeptidyl aminopeptidase/acylaminoacyl peptidase